MDARDLGKLEGLAKLIRYHILHMTTIAGSGHPTSSLSATELMASLFFGGVFKFNLSNPGYCNNDRLIFSKGHASPLFYALWAAADEIAETELDSYRNFSSRLEGHPTIRFPLTEAATGSLGQGLSIGLGMALNAKYIDKLPYNTFVLLGDSEMSEGSQWEAIEMAAYYKLSNLIGVLDVNRLGQAGETMMGYDLDGYARKFAAFGWQTYIIDGHSFEEALDAYEQAITNPDKPSIIIAKTVKGKGISYLEDMDGWHGKALSEDEYQAALQELGAVDLQLRGQVAKPAIRSPAVAITDVKISADELYKLKSPTATRKIYGKALAHLAAEHSNIIVLDAEVKNSTFSFEFQDQYPERFFEMYIAEQNMVSAALGLSRRGKIPFVSTFAAFFSRAFDQIRMSQYSDANIKFVGSHAGVAIGEDGPSQMGLEDIAMFRTLLDSVVLYPADAIAAIKCLEIAANHPGIVYVRMSRGDTPIIYNRDDEFKIGDCKVVKSSDSDLVTVIGAGITLVESLVAYEMLQHDDNVNIRVIDLYSIKPINGDLLAKACEGTRAIISVEDHYSEGGIGEALRTALQHERWPIYSLAVRKRPQSGTPGALLDYAEISAKAIAQTIRNFMAGWNARKIG